MQFFIDTADTEEIKRAIALGLADGVTTNPSLIAKSGRRFEDVIKEICAIVSGPVSAEVVSTESEGMISEAGKLAKLHEQIVVKIPLTVEGLKATRWCADNGIKTNVTLCFSPLQALLAAKASAQQKSHTLRVAAGGLRSQGFLSFNPRRSATERLHEVFALDFCFRKKAVTSWETVSSIDILLFFGECRERGCGGTCALKAELGLHEVA